MVNWAKGGNNLILLRAQLNPTLRNRHLVNTDSNSLLTNPFFHQSVDRTLCLARNPVNHSLLRHQVGPLPSMASTLDKDTFLRPQALAEGIAATHLRLRGRVAFNRDTDSSTTALRLVLVAGATRSSREAMAGHHTAE